MGHDDARMAERHEDAGAEALDLERPRELVPEAVAQAACGEHDQEGAEVHAARPRLRRRGRAASSRGRAGAASRAAASGREHGGEELGGERRRERGPAEPVAVAHERADRAEQQRGRPEIEACRQGRADEERRDGDELERVGRGVAEDDEAEAGDPEGAINHQKLLVVVASPR